MKIYYQGNIGSYMQLASSEIAKNLDTHISEFVGVPDFADVWENISDENIGVLAIENSYMGSIHQNLYSFLHYDHKIIGNYDLEIKHCLCGLESDISNIEVVYSQAPALAQCREYIKKHGFKEEPFGDTALSAKYIKENKIRGAGAICSQLAAEHYGLNILDRDIADQKGNTTRFIAIVPKNSQVKYKNPSGKISMIFEAKDIPSSLYKCLGAFATQGINMTKIESLPSYHTPFYRVFWLDIDIPTDRNKLELALEELRFFVKDLKILGEY